MLSSFQSPSPLICINDACVCSFPSCFSFVKASCLNSRTTSWANTAIWSSCPSRALKVSTRWDGVGVETSYWNGQKRLGWKPLVWRLLKAWVRFLRGQPGGSCGVPTRWSPFRHAELGHLVVLHANFYVMLFFSEAFISKYQWPSMLLWGKKGCVNSLKSVHDS